MGYFVSWVSVRFGVCVAVGLMVGQACDGSSERAAVVDGGSDVSVDTSAGAGGTGPDASVDCRSDKECTPLGMLCDMTSGKCVACRTSADCEDAGVCESGRCVTRTVCKNSLDCVGEPDNRTVCDSNRGRCVQCLSAEDCPEHSDCTANACVPYTSCINSLDCPSQTVCDTSAGRCVQCVASADCSEDQLCVANVCRKSCASDIVCTPMGLLCDKTNGYCAQCLAHGDCADSQHCAMGKCAPDLCASGEASCVGTAIALCLPNGEGFGPAVACPAGRSCATAAGAARCEDGSGGAGGAGLLIDDMEDGDQRILNAAGRTGYWRAWNDGTGTQSPSMTETFLPQVLEAPRGASTRAMHTTGSGFGIWGAVVQVDFNNPASGISGGVGSPGVYGTIGYQGISFYARGTSLRVEVRTLATVVVAEGGNCTATCNDHHGVNVTLSTAWAPVTVPFSSLAQRGFGTSVAFSPDQVIGIQFLPSSTTFDYWIDDLTFY